MKRRSLIKAMGAVGLVSALPISALKAAAAEGKSLNVLFMGGTGFIGPHMVRAVKALGHKVTLFNRGKTGADLFPELELVKGDRLTDDVNQLSGRRWDLIVDSSCYVPRAVRLLMGVIDTSQVQQYIFISTISVYKDFSKPNLTEESELATMEDPTSEEIGKYYGALKVLCEQEAEKALPGKVTHVRCGLIVGPGDKTDRFTYWPERIFKGGEVLAPGDGSEPFQMIDVRDLAGWVAYCLQNQIVGVYNATNGQYQYSVKQVLTACQELLNPSVSLTWVPHQFLLEQGVQQMSDLPFWVDPNGAMGGIWAANTSKAAANGLAHRPLHETIVDTHNWFQSLPDERRNTMKAGWTQEREAQVLAVWHQSSVAS